MRRVLEGEVIRGLEFAGSTFVNPGVERAWRNNWEPHRNEQGKIIGVTISADKVTEEKDTREALRQAAREKDEFLAMLAHELRNPLAPIRNAAVLLTRQIGTDPKLGALTSMVSRHAQPPRPDAVRPNRPVTLESSAC